MSDDTKLAEDTFLNPDHTGSCFLDYFAFWRPKKVSQQSGQGNSTLYVRVGERLWTQPVKLGPRASGWPAYEVLVLTRARLAGKTDQEVRALVAELEAVRSKSHDEICALLVRLGLGRGDSL